MSTVVMILQMLCAIALIISIMLQSGKSGGLSSAIGGGGGAESFFGKKKGIDKLLAKLSIASAVLFFVLTLALAIV